MKLGELIGELRTCLNRLTTSWCKCSTRVLYSMMVLFLGSFKGGG
jgi:hypothetical protein